MTIRIFLLMNTFIYNCYTSFNNLIPSEFIRNKGLSKKEFVKLTSLLQSKEYSEIFVGVSIVEGLMDENLIDFLLDGLTYKNYTLKTPDFFNAGPKAKPYTTTALLGILQAASAFPKWNNFITKIKHILLVCDQPDYLGVFKQADSVCLLRKNNYGNYKPEIWNFPDNVTAGVAIGNQIWMEKNLSIDKFSNGERIPEAMTESQWYSFQDQYKPGMACYNYNANNETVCGKLYNGISIIDSRKLAPKGWHIPSSAEFEKLITHLGGHSKAGNKLKSKTGWAHGGHGNNKSGFNAFPGGYINYQGINYGPKFENYSNLPAGYIPFEHGPEVPGDAAGWWTTDLDTDPGKSFLYYVEGDSDNVHKTSNYMSDGFSVRCIWDYSI